MYKLNNQCSGRLRDCSSPGPCVQCCQGETQQPSNQTPYGCSAKLQHSEILRAFPFMITRECAQARGAYPTSLVPEAVSAVSAVSPSASLDPNTFTMLSFRLLPPALDRTMLRAADPTWHTEVKGLLVCLLGLSGMGATSLHRLLCYSHQSIKTAL